jgi:hypothetical protein
MRIKQDKRNKSPGETFGWRRHRSQLSSDFRKATLAHHVVA